MINFLICTIKEPYIHKQTCNGISGHDLQKSEISRKYEIEMNVEKTKVMIISRQPSTVRIMIDQSQLENVKYFKQLGSITASDSRCKREIKFKIATHQEEDTFSQQT